MSTLALLPKQPDDLGQSQGQVKQEESSCWRREQSRCTQQKGTKQINGLTDFGFTLPILTVSLALKFSLSHAFHSCRNLLSRVNLIRICPVNITNDY